MDGALGGFGHVTGPEMAAIIAGPDRRGSSWPRFALHPRGGRPMNRRSLLKALAAAIASAPGLLATALFPSPASAVARSASRIRPGDPAWPAQADWDRLSQAVGGRLVKVVSPLAACASAPSSDDCTQLFKELKNPYYLGDEVGLTH